MAKKMVSLKIDDRTISAPEGMLIVDAAKLAGVNIPVFCYHPKMESVGMCRMCLVDIGRPVVDRATGQVVLLEDGSPKIQFGPKLDTSCTVPVSEGMVVVTKSDKVKAARQEVVEFILTSHPLDCPVCDKGGECPLQNLTMSFGPGTSRFVFTEKMHLAKHVALGELIYLDRERCIQCARCVRFQHEVVDDPVIAFYNRGRALEIMTQSEPGFDSIFSGNTTDICPVGALTTVDFHFGARPWELKPAASICNHCPVGCNLVYNVRREAKAGGGAVIKRVLPRQNESVNEIWLCDKGRLGYHYSESTARLTQPQVRKDGKLVPVTWDEALDLAAKKLKEAGSVIGLAGGRLANEDLFNLRRLVEGVGGKVLLHSYMAGGERVASHGMAPGSNFGEMGKGTVIIVAASDLHQEAPIWWLRIKQAVKRGAKLIVIQARPTRLEKYASQVIRCAYGEEAAKLSALLPDLNEIENLVILFGAEGQTLAGTQALAVTGARLLDATEKTGHPNSGLIGVWPAANTQGAFEIGFRPAENLAEQLKSAGVALIAAADPAGDDPDLAAALDETAFVIVQELFLTETARLADIVLPVSAQPEREGTFTSGERRVQRFYMAVPNRPGPRADFAIEAQIGQRLNLDLEGRSPALVLGQMTTILPAFAGLSYQKLAESPEQWPIIGRSDLYFGGTTYDNHQGLGVTLNLLPAVTPQDVNLPDAHAVNGLLVVPVTRLYDQGQMLQASTLLDKRMARLRLSLNPATAARLGLHEGEMVEFRLKGQPARLEIHLDEGVPADTALLPRSVGYPLTAPVSVEFGKVCEVIVW
jgi:NADH-quinone oxidoreductase subunit G